VPHRAIGIARAYRLHDRLVARAVGRGRFDVVHVWPQAALRTIGVATRKGAATLREVPSTHTADAYEAFARAAADAGMPAGSALVGHVADPRRLAIEEEEYRRADALLGPSEYSARTFRARGFDDSRLLLHRFGCDPGRFLPAEAPPGAEPARGLTAVFAGRCEPSKGLHLALRAWLESGAAERGRLLIIGSFMPDYREALGDLLAHPSVQVQGFVEDVAGLMREGDVLLLPSLVEGSALVTYEAQASGLVPVVSDAAGARCVHDVDGLVHPAGDVALLTDHLRRLDGDRELLLRLREATLARRDELTWQAAARELVGCYQRAVALAAT
jgi:glycosyltransferase involved in cell wall biosynthesis